MSEVRDFDPLAKAIAEGDDFERNQIDSPIPSGIKPFNHLIAVMKIAPRKMSTGGIILPDKARDSEDFMNNIGRIAAIGPAAFRSPWWRERGYTRIDNGEAYDTVAERGTLKLPRIGDLIRMSGVRNRQYRLNGVWLVEIEDTQIRGFVEKEDVHAYQFWR